MRRVLNKGLAVLWAGLATSGVLAGLPVDIGPAPGEDPNRPGIVVPAPLRGGTETNAPAPSESVPTPGPTGPRLHPAPRATNDWLRLENQDVVPGRFLGWEDGAVRWEVADALRPVRFRDSNVNRWVWAAPAPPAPGADRWVVRLTDGSLLTAQEVRLEEKTVVAIGTAAGPLRLPRQMVAALYRNPYPAGKDCILHKVGDWNVVVGHDDNGRQSYAEVLPSEPVLLEFDWPPADASRRFTMSLPLPAFHGLDGDLDVANHVSLQFHNNRLQVQRQGEGFGGDGVTVTRPRSARPRVAVALHPGTGSVAVYVDGKLVGTKPARLPVEPVPRGIWVYDSASGALPFPAVLITPIHQELSLPVVPLNADLIRLANGDATVGALTGLTATNFSFTGPQGALTLPVERFVGVVFATDGRDAPRRRDNDVQLHFHDGGQLVGELKRVTADQVIVENGVFGQAAWPRASVQRLQLGLYRPAPAAANPDLPRETQPGTLGLRGGSLLNGQLLGVRAQTVAWQHPHALDPLEFALTNVVFANLAVGALTNLPTLPARVRLTNGDQLRGDLVGVNAQSVQLRSWHTGLVRLPRRQVAELRPGAPPEGVLGTGPIENWTTSGSAQGASLVYSRKLPLPPRVRLQFQVESSRVDGALDAQVWLYSQMSTNKHHQGPLGHLLGLQNNQISVGHCSHNPTDQSTAQTATSHNAPGLGQCSVSEIIWLLDTVKGEAFVLLDGKQIAQIRDLRKMDLGQEIRFQINNPTSVRLRSVVIAEWTAAADFAAAAQSDAVRLHDFSLLTGPVEGVRDGMVCRAGQAAVPLVNVFSLFFNPTESERVRRTAQDVRVTLWDGDELTLANLEVTARGVTGTSEAWGEVALPANAIRRLNFRPYDPPPPPANPSGPRTSDLHGGF